MRKPILIIDDKERFPDPGPYRDLIVVKSEIDREHLPDESAYATAFVHARPDWLRVWAKRRFKPAFVFTGGETHASVTDDLYTLPRDVYERRFADFLAHYAATGELNPQIFMEHVAASTMSAGDVPTSDAIPPGYIRFSTEASDPDRHVYAVVKSEQGIDYAKTLTPLAGVLKPTPIALAETYVNPGDGLELLMRIRLSGHPISRWPAYVRLDAPLEGRRLRPQIGALLFTPNTYLVDVYPPLSGLQVKALTDRELLEDVLLALPIRPEGMRGAHDLANEWGPVRLWRGFNALRPEPAQPPSWVKEQEERLLSLEHYAYLLALARTRSTEETSGKNIQKLQEAYKAWIQFLQDHARDAKKLQVLVIDDELNAGWGDALIALFKEVPGSAWLNTEIGNAPFNYKKAKGLALSKKWDLVLCDLRLTPKDANKRGDEKKTGYDPAGINLIREIKERHPTVPIIAFTASRQSWLLQKLEDEGVDGYWSKERPSEGVSDLYSASQAAELLNQIREAVSRRERHAFLWDFVEALDRSRRQALVEYYKALHKEPDIHKRLDAIRDLLVRAYGYLHQRTTRFQEKLFAHHPTDIAFLHVWGCVNEILLLRFKNVSPNKGIMLTAQGERLPYYDEGTPASFVLEAFPCEEEARRLELEQGEVQSLSPAKPNGKGMASPDSNAHMRLLLLYEGRCDLADLFERYRRDIRNRLDLIHGESLKTRASHARLEDVRGLVEVLRFALRG